MLIAGPIAQYKKFVNSVRESPPPPSLTRLIESISIISTGLFYKYFVAEGLRIYAYGVSGVVQYEGWVDSAFLLVYLFFDFAGYSLVALGVGKACFIHTPINFKKPFFSRSITEFWERWHISLGEFVRRNIYLPLQAGLVRKYGIARSQSVAFVTMIISFGLVGLWHKISVSFVLWGVFLGVVMGLEKIVRDKFVRKYGTKNKRVNLTVKVIGPVYVFSVISTSLGLVINEVF
jgi:D-alanyl-lipoteichoic acid acyltransferase DltB (MBOAT superfamily)